MADLTIRIVEWARAMGYDGDIPESLNKICSPSVAFIWEQIVSNVKSKQDVANVRKNIIIHRLRQKPLSGQHEFDYPVKEIKVLVKKRALEKRVITLEKAIEEKETLVNDLLKKNKITYVAIDNIKAKIKENFENKFLLEEKCKLLQNDLDNAEEVLTLAKNLTPVEMEESANANDVADILQKCAEKLHKLVQYDQCTMNASQLNLQRHFSLTTIEQKTPRNFQTKYNKGLNISTFRNENKENISLSVCAKRCSEKKENDSLCLLPGFYLESCDEFDEYFLSKVSENSNESLIKTSFNKSHNSSQREINYEIFEKLRDDQQVKDTLKSLLYNNNRQLIVKCCQKLNESLLSELTNSTLKYNKLNKSTSFLDRADLNNLYFLHIKNELERENHYAVVTKLQEKMRRKKEEIYDLVRKQKEIFELQVEETFLIAANNFLRQKLECLKKPAVNDELQAKIQKIEEETFSKFMHMRVLIENIQKIFELIKTSREETSSYIRSIRPYIFDLSMATSLKDDLNSQEVQVFENFPLEFNRRFLNNDLKCFYRNISESSIPSYVNLESDDLEMITALMDTPFSPVENIAVNTIRMKLKLKLLRSFQVPQPEHQNLQHNYTKEELCRREKYINEIISKLRYMMNSKSVKEVLSSPEMMKETVDLWTEMPFKNFISEKRMVEGHTYKSVEKTFDALYNSL